VTYARFDEFAHDLHDFFATGSRIEAGAMPARSAAAPAAPAARK
jgi:biopolymer transport protein ExbB